MIFYENKSKWNNKNVCINYLEINKSKSNNITGKNNFIIGNIVI